MVDAAVIATVEAAKRRDYELKMDSLSAEIWAATMRLPADMRDDFFARVADEALKVAALAGPIDFRNTVDMLDRTRTALALSGAVR